MAFGGIPIDFFLFALTLLGVALYHRHTLRVALTGLAVIAAYAVGFGGSMLWFGSSAGGALSTMYPQARSVGAWLKGGWHVALAYVAGFLVLLAVSGWHPDAPASRSLAAHGATIPLDLNHNPIRAGLRPEPP